MMTSAQMVDNVHFPFAPLIAQNTLKSGLDTTLVGQMVVQGGSVFVAVSAIWTGHHIT